MLKGKSCSILCALFMTLTTTITTTTALASLPVRGSMGHTGPRVFSSPERSALPGEQAGDFALKDGDRVLFYGDSITEQRLYTTYVEHYVLTHYPERRVTFINTGWGGDKVTGNDCQPCAGVGGMARLRRDVIDYRPTVVTLLFGMNDGEYKDFDPPTLKVYEDGLAAIIQEIKTQLPRAKLYLMTPTVYDPSRHTPWSHTDRYNEVLDRYSEAARKLASREGLPVIDLHAVTTRALRLAKEVDPAYTFAPDGVHPEADGQLVMAAEILRAWGARPEGLELSRQIKLDGNPTASLNVPAPLPWPAPQPSATLKRVWPQINALGHVGLKITGLRAGNYSLRVDGRDAGEYTAEKLGSGIPLDALAGQSAEASIALAALVRQRADLFFMRWRQVQVPYAREYKTAPASVSSLDALAKEMSEHARTLGQMHVYQITLVRKS